RTDKELVEKRPQLPWLRRVRFVRQIGWTHCRLPELIHGTLLEGHKSCRLQEAVVVQIGYNALDVVTEHDMPTELLRKSVLDIGQGILAIRMAGNKKCRGSQHNMALDHPFRVAQTDVLLAFVLNGKRVKVAERWQCHAGKHT